MKQNQRLPSGDIEATLQFLSAAAGGRESPTPSRRLGCIFVIGGESHECALMLEGQSHIAPGETATVSIKFLDLDKVKPKLIAGLRFQLRDYRLIANGTIVAVNT